MAEEFGLRLRKALVDLQQRSAEVLRRRTSSTDTRRISLDSMGSSEADSELINNESIRRAFENK